MRHALRLILAIAVTTVFASAGDSQPGKDKDKDKPKGDGIVAAGATLEKLFDGGVVLTEGCAAAPDGTIYFSDITFTHVAKEKKAPIEAGHIWKFDPKTKKTTIFRSPSNSAATAAWLWIQKGQSLRCEVNAAMSSRWPELNGDGPRMTS